MLINLFRKNREIKIPIFTIGGWLTWEDIYIRDDWRIQKNIVINGLYRLIDNKYKLKASGSLQYCKKLLSQSKKEKKYNKVVILIHGVLCHKLYMTKIEKKLKKQGYTTFNFGYASNAYEISHHSKIIETFAKNIQYKEMNFVTFSMGGLVARQFINRIPRMKRLVMIAPPNKGSDMADIFGRSKLINAIFGPGLKQMESSIKSFANRSPLPKCEFGIIAGKIKNHKGWWHPTRILYTLWHKKKNDGLVSVEQTKLKQMKDFIVLPYDHAVIPFKKKTIKQVINFIKKGKFKHD
ncbi:hypothetical protein HOG48_00260 [Candidatus Peregrinibacteria bacterium]|jgi:hypothetical protein|nr:hypothetical protein [Candidatus Peregrinibacteria bacterium]